MRWRSEGGCCELTLNRWEGCDWRVYVGYQFVAESSCSEWGCDASVVSEVDADASGVSWGDADAEWHCGWSGFSE